METSSCFSSSPVPDRYALVSISRRQFRSDSKRLVGKKFAPKSKASGLSAGRVSLLGERLGEPYSASGSLTALREEIGWGGRIRTSTVLINSEVSYRLDHAPAADEVGSAARAIHGKVCF